MQEQLPRRAKPLSFQVSNNFPRVVIHHVEAHHIRRVTPRLNTSSCLGTVGLRG